MLQRVLLSTRKYQIVLKGFWKEYIKRNVWEMPVCRLYYMIHSVKVDNRTLFWHFSAFSLNLYNGTIFMSMLFVSIKDRIVLRVYII